MFQTFASTAFVAGTLFVVSMPFAGFAKDHDGRSGGGRSHSSGPAASRSYAPRGYSGGSQYAGRSNFVSPRASVDRGYAGRSYIAPRGYAAPRYYARPGYRAYPRGGVYLGFGAGAPYGYAYGPGYAYNPGYGYDPGYTQGPGYAYDPGYTQGPGYSTEPPPSQDQACTDGSYDRNGNWIPSPNCDPNQQQYSQPQYPQQQQQQQQQEYRPPQQQYYDPNRTQRYNR